MRKLLFILLFVVGILKVSAQASKYHPFPDSNTVWRVNTKRCNSCPGHGWCFTQQLGYYQYILGGDTVIGSYTYKKIFRSGMDSSVYCNSNGTYAWQTFYRSLYYAGGLRQDTSGKKVYFIDTNPERLIYDFSKQIGDTLCLWAGYWNATCYTSKITSIDSVLVGNNFHKRFNVKNPSGQYDSTAFIEGVGSNAGLLEGYLDRDGCCHNLYNQLICFHYNSDYYPATSTSCTFVPSVGVKETSNVDNGINIYPNPVNNILNVNTKEIARKLELINLLGETVLIVVPKNNLETINIESLPRGIYFVRVSNSKGNYVRKIFVE